MSRPHAYLIVTDFHAQAVHAGHTRTFRDAAGHLHAVEHHVHTLVDHERAAARVGLKLGVHRDLVGPELQGFYEEAGMLDAYEAHRGLPLVLALAFRR